MNWLHIPVGLILAIAVASCQEGLRSTLEFDVASVKLGTPPVFGIPPVMRGGPGTSEPGRITYSSVSLMNLLTTAYGVYADQILGPGWLISEYYTVQAVVPPGVTREQCSAMWQHLLAKRFQLVVEREEKDFTVYQLVIANGGLKLSRSSLGTDAGSVDVADALKRAAKDRDGCPVIRQGTRGALVGVGPDACSTFRGYSMPELVKRLEMLIALESGSYFGPQASQAHVVDRTGLSGEFDFTLHYSFQPRGMPPPPSGADSDMAVGTNLAAALERQLGLRLERTKARLPVYLVKHVSKIPTEN